MKTRLLFAAILLSGCSTDHAISAGVSASATTSAELEALARSLGEANVGIAIKPLGSEALVGVNLDRAMPMQSVFKAALAAAVLSRVDAGELDLAQRVELKEEDLAPPFSPIADGWPMRSGYSIAELIDAAAGHSDNTAADALLDLIGGPQAVTAFLSRKGIKSMRIDRTERQLQTESAGVAAFHPRMRGEAAWTATMAEVPEPARRAALARYLADPRDTATPRAAVIFLEKLSSGKLLSEPSTRLLLKVMTDSPTGGTRLRAGLPAGATVAHKTGTGRRIVGVASAMNDIGVVTLADGRRVAIAVFVNSAKASDSQIDALHASVAALAAR